MSKPQAGRKVGEREPHRHESAGYRGASRSAVGLDHVAIYPDGLVREQLRVNDGAERPSDQPLDLLAPAGRTPSARLPRAPLLGGGRQHSVFSGDPSLAGALKERRHLVLNAGAAYDLGEADFHQA